MSIVARIVIAAVVLVVVGTGIFLVTWDMPAPLAPKEKVLPDDRFPR